MDMMSHYPYAPLVQTIQNCEATCHYMIKMMGRRPDVQMRRKQIELLHDCAQACLQSVVFLSSDSQFAKRIIGTCALICEACGQECARHFDQASQNCARVCLHCARECAEFAGMM